MNRATCLAKFLVSVSLAVLLLFGLTVPAHATTLTSSALSVFSQALACTITNVGPHPITVTIQLLDNFGVVVTEDSQFIPPGRVGFVSTVPIFETAYCKFTGNFNRGFVRANAQILANGTQVVVPAQAVGE